MRDQDVKALDRLFADDIVITTFDGSVRGKNKEIQVLAPNPNYRIASVTNEDVDVKILGEVAVVTALTKLESIAGGKSSQLAMRYTAVFVKRDNSWQIVALQTARVAK